MTDESSYLVVRSAAVYLAVVLAGTAWIWRRPGPRLVAGALLATAWQVPALLAGHLLATRLGWWTFDAQGGLLLGFPVDVWLAWSCLWGLIPAIAFPRLSLALVVGFALVVDLVLMPAAAPLVRLGPAWLVGEVVLLAVALLPGQLLARWTANDTHLIGRAALQFVAFAGLVGFVVPVAAVEGSGAGWRDPSGLSAQQLFLAAQLLALPACLGISALQEFVTRGRGTPVPFDPPSRLVTTGIYAYVRNPMQISGVLVLVVLGMVMHNVWIAASGLLAATYSAGLAGWDEADDLRRRFGQAWAGYRVMVPSWVPRLRPWHAPDAPLARLYVAANCDTCREVANWFGRRDAGHLVILPAEAHPTRTLRRITYEDADDFEATGVAAIGRALEHTHLGWAVAGFVLRLPGVGPMIQLIVDASGGYARLAVRPHAQPGDGQRSGTPFI